MLEGSILRDSPSLLLINISLGSRVRRWCRIEMIVDSRHLDSVRKGKAFMFLRFFVLASATIGSLSAHCQPISEILAPAKKEQPVSIATNKQSLPSKQEFFQEASVGGVWWAEWGRDRYADGGATNSMIQKSAVLRHILESEWKVTIPFDAARIAAVRGSRVREALKGGAPVASRAGTNWCEGLTPVDLASSVAAVTAFVAPEYAYPNGNPLNVKQNAKEYLEAIFLGLDAYCAPLDRGAFVSAFKTFLDEYARVIQVPYAQAKAAVQAAEESKRKDEAERKTAEVKAALAASKEKAERQERAAIAAKAREQESAERSQRQREADDRRIAAAAQYASDLRSKKITPKGFDDFVLLHDAQPGTQIILYPPLEPDKKTYFLGGRFEREDGTLLVFSVRMRDDVKYFAVRPGRVMFKEDGFMLRFEYPARVVGRLIGTLSYPTVAGTQRQMPVFEGIALGGAR